MLGHDFYDEMGLFGHCVISPVRPLKIDYFEELGRSKFELVLQEKYSHKNSDNGHDLTPKRLFSMSVN